MEIKIWSDIRCPFCYIGKKKLEAAMEQFPQKDKVKITWKSFQLDPNLKTDSSITTLDYFIKNKGVSKEQAKQMFSGAISMGREAGVQLKIEEGVPANSFMAHRLIQLAKSKGLANEVEEELFKVHFEATKNIDDIAVLLAVSTSIGMDSKEVKKILESDDFAYEVKQDEMEARNIGVTGVPFFVFEDKYAISGAQPTAVFLETLEKTWEDRKSKLEIIEGDACSPESDCN